MLKWMSHAETTIPTGATTEILKESLGFIRYSVPKSSNFNISVILYKSIVILLHNYNKTY